MEDNDTRRGLHDLLGRMLDEGKEVGNISHMTTLDYGVKIKNMSSVSVKA